MQVEEIEAQAPTTVPSALMASFTADSLEAAVLDMVWFYPLSSHTPVLWLPATRADYA